MGTTRFTSNEPDLDGFYGDVAAYDLQPLWLLEGLMTTTPTIGGAHRWAGKEMRALMERSGDLVTIDRGGDRRVLALCNPALGGLPYATTTLWGALQYLKPGEVAPAHRHSPGALRFVTEGSGVWTGVEGDAIAMAPGDLVLTPPWTWHEHHNPGDEAMIWFDALDLPIVQALDAVFFQPGANHVDASATPSRSASEARFGAAAGLVPSGHRDGAIASPLLAYRRADTDAALSALVSSAGGAPASVRYCDPTTGTDVMRTMRCEMWRVPATRRTEPTQEIGSSILVVYAGSGSCTINGEDYPLEPGDLVAVNSWATLEVEATSTLDLFRVSDAPVLEALGLERPRFGAD